MNDSQDKQIENLLARMKSLSLSSEEKDSILGRLREHMETYPADPSQALSPRDPYRIIRRRPVFSVFSFGITMREVVVTAVLIIFIGGSGTLFAAQDSLPGDILYPVKVNVTEKVQSLLAVDDASSARVEASHAATRLKEVEQLAASGRLDPSIQADEEKRFVRNAIQVATKVENLAARGDNKSVEEVSSDFESVLSTHATVLENISEKKEHTGTKGLLSEIVTTVNDHLATTTEVRKSAEAAIATTSNRDLELFVKDALEASDRAIDRVDWSVQEEASTTKESNSSDSARESVDSARTYRAEGEQKMKDGAYGDAFILFRKAHRTATQARILIESENSIRSSVDRGDDNNAPSRSSDH